MLVDAAAEGGWRFSSINSCVRCTFWALASWHHTSQPCSTAQDPYLLARVVALISVGENDPATLPSDRALISLPICNLTQSLCEQCRWVYRWDGMNAEMLSS